MLTAVLLVTAKKWNNPNVSHLRTGHTKAGVFTEWNTFVV